MGLQHLAGGAVVTSVACLQPSEVADLGVPLSSVGVALGAATVGIGVGVGVAVGLQRRQGSRAVRDQWRRSVRPDPLVHRPLAAVLADAADATRQGRARRWAAGAAVGTGTALGLWALWWGFVA